MLPLAGFGCGLAALLAAPLSAHAQDRTWQVGDGSWTTPGNWSGGVVPTIPFNAYINNSGTARLGAGGVGSAAALFVGSSNGGDNFFSLEGGYLLTNYHSIGDLAGSRGTVSVSSGTWVNTGVISVGSSGTGNFLMSGGQVVTSMMTLGNSAGSRGTMIVTGGFFATTGISIIGGNGAGSLTIDSTGLVSSGTTIVALAATSSGTLTLSGTTFTGTTPPYNVTVSSGTLVTGQVMAGNGDAAFNGSGGTLRLTQNQSELFYGFANGKVQLSGGGLTLDTDIYNAAIATGMSGTGTLTKVGTGTLTLTGSSSYGGTTVQDGAVVLNGGSLTNSGTITVSGSTGALLEVNGAFVSAADIEAGRGSIGTVNLSSGSISGGNFRVGINPGGEGTAIVTGGTVALSGNVTVASFGATGHLEISGGVVSSERAVLADKAGTGTALVSGGTLNVASLFWVGAHGTGTLTISGSGLVNTPEMYVARIGGAVGTLNLNGGVLATGSILEGAGTGTVNLNGGTLRLTQNQAALFDGFETGDVTIGAGGFFLDTAGYNVGLATSLGGSGVLTKVGTGTLTLTGSHGYTGGTTVRDGTLVVDGGSLDHSGDIYVSGSAGQNALMQVKSGSVNSARIEVGNVSAGTGTLSISGSNTRVSTGYLRMGDRGTGTLNLSSGHVSSGTSVLGAGGGLGIATVTGGTWSMGNALMGWRGVGALTISDGLVTAGLFEVGRDFAASVVVDGGRLDIDRLRVSSLAGSSFVLNSGTVTTRDAGIAYTYSGSAAVTGGSWTITEALEVGQGGNGFMEISGGVVSNADAFIGRYGIGTMVVSGGTWNTSGLLTVGYLRIGTVTISGTSQVNARDVAVATYASGTGVLNLNGGLLASTTVSKGPGTATFTWNSGTLRATGTSAALVSGFTSGIDIRSGGAVVDSNGYDVAITSAFTGSGAFTKTGAGALTLTGTSTYTGGTKIEAGTLIISDVGEGASVLGTGDVTVEENGKLAGIGTVLGDTFVAGTLAPGNSPGEMTFASNLFLESTATVQMELASATTYDQITVGGLLTYDGTLSITFLGGYIPTAGDTFALFDAGTVAPGTQFDSITFSDSGYAGELDYTTGILTVTAVPEPTAAALLVLGAVGVLARRRRR